MKLKQIVATILLGSPLLSGCSMLARPTPITITFSPQTQLVYMGNSAAMMSVIGPEGIAIGTAIDIGIAKDIEAQLIAQGGSQQLLTQCLHQQQNHLPIAELSEIHVTNMDIIPTDGGYYMQISGNIIYHKKLQPFTIGDTNLGSKGNLSNFKESPRLIQTLIQQTCEGMWKHIKLIN
jgi:ABC-type transport system involved in multi-copper enzyme maturation permease subunit